VEFDDFFIADQLNSLATVLLDIAFVICYYSTSWGDGEGTCTKKSLWYRLFLALLPPWFRFIQSIRRYINTKHWFPHLVNAGKYFSSIVVIVLSVTAGILTEQNTCLTILGCPVFIAYIIFACISTLYAYWWDIKMDWGFLDHTSTGHKNKYLRDELLYAGGKKFVYFIIIGLDLILRCVWTINISLTDWDFVHKQIIVTITAVLEVIRRAIWNFIRLENEHLNNCGQFRAVRDINVRVISDQDRENAVDDEGSDEEDEKRIEKVMTPFLGRSRAGSRMGSTAGLNQGVSNTSLFRRNRNSSGAGVSGHEPIIQRDSLTAV